MVSRVIIYDGNSPRPLGALRPKASPFRAGMIGFATPRSSCWRLGNPSRYEDSLAQLVLDRTYSDGVRAVLARLGENKTTSVDAVHVAQYEKLKVFENDRDVVLVINLMRGL